MKSKNKKLLFKNVVGDWKTFAAVLAVFSIVSILIAVKSDFPLPYDEQYHVTLIQYYSQQLTPFISSQPEQLSIVGDATRYGSYLSHYLLSFPLWLVAQFTSDIGVQVLILRLINIAFVVMALILFRIFIAKLTGSKLKANLSVAILAALPATSLLAAHVNYDNPALLMFAGLLLLTQAAIRDIKVNGRVSASLLLGIMSVALLGSLVKFTFLPLAAVTLFYVAGTMAYHKVLPSFGSSSIMAKAVLGVMVVTSVVATGLFSERYIGNVISYKSLQPDCSTVQSVSICMQYGPWARNYALEQTALHDTTFQGRSVEGYIANIWLPTMIKGLGGVDNQGKVAELSASILIVAKVLIVTIAIAIAGAVISLRKNTLLLMIIAAVGLYSLALLERNYSEFMSLHEVVAVQGRYILPLVVPLVAVAFMGMKIYMDVARKLAGKFAKSMKFLYSATPDEAYTRSEKYWSSKVRSKRLTNS